MLKFLFRHKVIFLLTITVLLSSSCSKNKNQPQNIPSGVKMPDWVYNPAYEDGVAAAQCVIFSGNVSLDQQEVTAKGRSSLAQQINLRAQVMDEVYQNKTQSENKVTSGSVFTNVSRQLTDQVLIGSKLVRTDFGEVKDDQYLCGLVAITSEETEKLFNAIVSSNDAPQTSAQDKDILYQEFKAYKAQQRLEDALQ